MSYGSRIRRGGPLLTLMALGLTALACSDPVATNVQSNLDAPPLVASAAPKGISATVTGAAHFQLKDPPPVPFKWVYRFSFNVEKRTDGSVGGTVKFSSRIPPGRDDINFPGDWWAETEIDCLQVVGNTAWMSGEIVRTRTDSPLGPALRDVAMLVVQDNGANAVDVVDVGPAAAFGATDCNDRPAFFPGSFTDGNVTIRTY